MLIRKRELLEFFFCFWKICIYMVFEEVKNNCTFYYWIYCYNILCKSNHLVAKAPEKIKYPKHGLTTILCDNRSAICLTKNLIIDRSQHIEIKYDFIRVLVRKEKIKLEYCKSEDRVEIFGWIFPLKLMCHL